MARRLIYEEAGSHNAVFLGFNEHNAPAYAFKRGIHSGLKTEAAGSSKTYSFRLEDPESEDLRVFEGAIDLLSFITLSKILCSYLKPDMVCLLFIGVPYVLTFFL